MILLIFIEFQISELIVTPIHQCTTIIYPNKESKITHERKAKL